MAAIRKGFSVAHLNIRSLHNKIDELAVLIEATKPKVLTLTETWLTGSVDSTVLMLDGYNLYRADRARLCPDNNIVTRGGGLAIYTQEDLLVDNKKFVDYNLCNKDIEIQVLNVKSPGDKGTIILNTYRPPSGNLPIFHECVLSLINDLCGVRYLDQIFWGDINLDHGLSNNNISLFQSSLKIFGFRQLIDKPTRRTVSTASIIDVIYSKTCKSTEVDLLL